jgi:hypothetical protein
MKYIVQILFLILLSVTCVGSSSDADCAYKVAIVYSYDYQDVKDNKEIKDKIELIRGAHPHVMIMSVYLNYSRQMSEQKLRENAASAFKKIDSFRPNLTLVYDNVAFEQVAVEYLYPHQYDTAFLDVWKRTFNDSESTYKLRKKYGVNVGGVLLVGDAARLKRVMNILNVEYVYIIKNDSRYYSGIASELAGQLKPFKTETYDVTSTIELGTALRTLSTKPRGVIIFLIKDVSNGGVGGVASVRQIASIIIALNSKHFEIAYLDNYSKYGVASSDLLTNRPKDKVTSVIDKIIVERINSKKSGTKEKSNDFIINVDRVKTLGFDVILSSPEVLDGTDDIL